MRINNRIVGISLIALNYFNLTKADTFARLERVSPTDSVRDSVVLLEKEGKKHFETSLFSMGYKGGKSNEHIRKNYN